MPQKRPKKTPNPYPYTIHPVSIPPDGQLEKLSPQAIWEFLRIEALLRSRTVMNWYRKGRETGEAFFEEEFNLPWKYFNHRFHHRYLDPKDASNRHATTHGVSDLGPSLRLGLTNRKIKTVVQGFLFEPNTVLLCIDSTFPPSMNKDRIDEILRNAHKATVLRLEKINNLNAQILNLGQEFDQKQREIFDECKTSNPDMRHIKSLQRQVQRLLGKLGPLYNRKQELERLIGNTRFAAIAHRGKKNFLQTYMTNFQCYDLHQAQGIPFGEINKNLFGAKLNATGKQLAQGRDRAKKASKQANVIINCAENNLWPPPSDYLKKRQN